MTTSKKITVEATINAPVANVWNAWNKPSDIMNWNSPDPSWHCPSSKNDLKVGGTFNNRMEAKDGSYGFDFEGTYNKVELHKEITYTMSDGRVATTLFAEKDGKTHVETTFDAETENSEEIQKGGWQAILTNFKNYVEKPMNA